MGCNRSCQRSATTRRRWLALAGLLGLSLLAGGCMQPLTRDEAAETPATEPRPPPPPAADHGPGEEIPCEHPDAVPQPQNLWDRLRAGYALPAVKHPRIDAEVDRYTRNPASWQRYQQRAEPFLHYIVDSVAERDLPHELALLPLVESGFRTRARSEDNAVGLWQFIPSTGRAAGLRQTWWYDGRRDVASSTQAALDHLEELRDAFRGDWLLALAAYNAGRYAVRRAQRLNRVRGEATDYWSLDLPLETERYVPRLLAVARIVAEPERYDITLNPLPDEPIVAVVDLDSQIELKRVAALAGMSLAELQALNPGFARWATDPDGPHQVLIPVEKAAQLEDGLGTLNAEERVRWQRYRIVPGDTLGGIAGRHQTTVAVLQHVNGIRGSRIHAGKHLMIPHGGGDDAPIALPIETSLPVQRPQRYRVRAGDSLWSIGRRYGLNHRDLARRNGLNESDLLRAGQWLTLDGGARHLQLASAVSTSRPARYRVQPGDSLYRIAGRFNLSVSELRRWNDLQGSLLRPGQELRLRPAATSL